MPSTMYRDYALSPELFLWGSQKRTFVESPVGRRYLAQPQAGTHVLLLVREHKQNEWGGTQAYTCSWPATGELHRRSKPNAIADRLLHPMRGEDCKMAPVVA